MEEGARATFELPAGEAFGERNPEMVQWVARKLLNELGDPDEQYQSATWCSSPRPTAWAVRRRGAAGRQEGDGPMPCCSTSTTRWRASR
jgi:FKBP-type peptidyl-prolyl cis-trans isomerase SlpA